jgi:hypothetical protein
MLLEKTWVGVQPIARPSGRRRRSRGASAIVILHRFLSIMSILCCEVSSERSTLRLYKSVSKTKRKARGSVVYL